MLEEQNENFYSSGDRRRNASGNECKVKISGSEQKGEQEHV